MNPLRQDPTRTTTLRNAYMSDFAKRMRSLRGAIIQELVKEDAYGLKQRSQQLPGAIFNTKYAFQTDPEKVATFSAWLDEQVDAGVLEVKGDGPWHTKYIDSAYKKGVVRSYTDANKLALADQASLYEGGQAQFLSDSFGGPEAAMKVKLLATRSFEHMKGLAGHTKQQLNTILANGIANGHGVNKITSTMTKAIGSINKKRARTIARTEIIHAHAEGQLDSFAALGVTELGVMAEWSTAGDDKVCAKCQPLEGIVITVKEARGMIPRHPNCRCGWIPANVGEPTKNQTWANDEVAYKVRESLKAELPKVKDAKARRDLSTWLGASKKFKWKGNLKPKAGPNVFQTKARLDRAFIKTEYNLHADDIHIPKKGSQFELTPKGLQKVADAEGYTGAIDIPDLPTKGTVKVRHQVDWIKAAAKQEADNIAAAAAQAEAQAAKAAATKAKAAQDALDDLTAKYTLPDKPTLNPKGGVNSKDFFKAVATENADLNLLPDLASNIVTTGNGPLADQAAFLKAVRKAAKDQAAKAKAALEAAEAAAKAKAAKEAAELKAKQTAAKKAAGIADDLPTKPTGALTEDAFTEVLEKELAETGITIDELSPDLQVDFLNADTLDDQIKFIKGVQASKAKALAEAIAAEAAATQAKALAAKEAFSQKVKMGQSKGFLKKKLGLFEPTTGEITNSQYAPGKLAKAVEDTIGRPLTAAEEVAVSTTGDGTTFVTQWKAVKGLLELEKKNVAKLAKIKGSMPGPKPGAKYFSSLPKNADGTINEVGLTKMAEDALGLPPGTNFFDDLLNHPDLADDTKAALQSLALDFTDDTAAQLKAAKSLYGDMYKAKGSLPKAPTNGPPQAYWDGLPKDKFGQLGGQAIAQVAEDALGLPPGSQTVGTLLDNPNLPAYFKQDMEDILLGDSDEVLGAIQQLHKDLKFKKAELGDLTSAPKTVPTPPATPVAPKPVPTPTVAPVTPVAPKAPPSGSLGPVQKHVDDAFFNDFLKAAKTISVHADDKAYNTASLASYDNAKIAINKAIKEGGHDDATAAMLAHYADAAKAIDAAKDAGTKLGAGSLKEFEYQPVIKPLGKGDLLGVGKDSFSGGSTFKVVNTNLGGSTGAKHVQVTTTGLNKQQSDWVLKDYSGRSVQAENEYVANKIYNLVQPNSAPVSQLATVKGPNGNSVGVFNKFVENGTEIGKLKGAAKTAANKQAKDGFVMDAWLGNWDAVGMGGDNMMVAGGKVVRIDNGGALLFRAQGGLKGKAFGDKVTELETLLDASSNPNAAKVFKGITKKQISSQIQQLEEAVAKQGGMDGFLDAAGINNISDTKARQEIVETLTERFNHLVTVRDEIEGLTRVPLPQRVSRIKEVQVVKRETKTVSTKTTGNKALRAAVKKKPAPNVTEFTGGGYGSINSAHMKAVRKGEVGTAKVAKINEQLADLPGYSGTLGRGQRNLSDKQFAAWEDGTHAQAWWVAPSSSSARPANVFGSGSDGVCYIVMSKGKRNGWVQDISRHKSEHEALFMGDSVFRVRATAKGSVSGGSHRRLVVLEEMDAGQIPPVKQGPPPKLNAQELWGAFENDANRAGMHTSGSKKGISVVDLLKKAEEAE